MLKGFFCIFYHNAYLKITAVRKTRLTEKCMKITFLAYWCDMPKNKDEKEYTFNI
jgi:hypothetical protein